MRDPAASVTIAGNDVQRRLYQELTKDHFLRSRYAQTLVENQQLTPFTIVDETSLVSPRVPFVTYPYEWCDAQLFRAAQLTLDLQKSGVAEGFDLKDASAWNVIYAGTKPVFCDLLSFQPLARREWWAMGQFARHFLLPLVVAKRRGLRAHEGFKAWRDGIPTETAKSILGAGRFITRYWSLVAGGRPPSDTGATPNGERAAAPTSDPIDKVTTFRNRLHVTLQWMLEGVAPPAAQPDSSERGWSAYTEQRDHYVGDSFGLKRSTVTTWLTRLEPAWVGDFGCNTGEFSQIALELGAHVVALDGDHDSIRRLFRRFPDNERLFPVLADLDDLAGGRGWAGSECPGLVDRLARRCDVVVALALIHHLAISSSIPLSAVARFLGSCTRQWIIVELLDESDPQLRSLCLQRLRDPKDFTLQHQLTSFLEAGFVVEESVSLAPAARTVVLLRRR
jgi:hypothetical protein